MIGRSILESADRSGIACAATSRQPGSQYFVELSEPPHSWRLPGTVETAVFCASMTGLAACEAEPEKSRAVNVTGISALADLLAARGTRIAFLSSNQVFGPDAAVPSEDDLPAPTTEYGRQKLAVERHLLEKIPGSLVIRLTKVVSPGIPLFVKWQKALRQGNPIRAYANLHFSPLALFPTASWILKVVNSGYSGVFHLSASDSISYLDAARWLAVRVGFDPALVQCAPTLQPNSPESCRLTCERSRCDTGFLPRPSSSNLEEAFSMAFR